MGTFLNILRKVKDMPYTLSYKKYCNYWLSNVVKDQLANSSLISYKSKLTNYVLPYVGRIQLASIRKYDIQNLVIKLNQSTGLSSSSIRQIFNIFNKSLKHAVEMDLIKKNPATGVKLPKAEKYTPCIYTDEEMLKLLDRASGTDIEIPILLASRMGLRRGEILALQWKDINFRVRTISISKTLSTGAEKFSKPKGKKATRALIMPTDVLNKLLLHLKNQENCLKVRSLIIPS